MKPGLKRNGLRWGLGVLVLITALAPAVVQAQVPPLVEAELVKMGRVVDPGCTGKLYRTLFDKNDYNTYWPVDAAMPNTKVKLYPGVTVTRDVPAVLNPGSDRHLCFGQGCSESHGFDLHSGRRRKQDRAAGC